MQVIDWDLMRDLVRRVESDAPFLVTPQLPKLHMPGVAPPPFPSEALSESEVKKRAEKMKQERENAEYVMRWEMPVGEGKEFEHWRHAHSLGLIKWSSKSEGHGYKIVGLTAKGLSFAELSRPHVRWKRVLMRCIQNSAATYTFIAAELRKAAAADLKNEK